MNTLCELLHWALTFRARPGFLAVFYVRPSLHNPRTKDTNPNVSWNPALHQSTNKQQWHNLRLLTTSYTSVTKHYL